MDSTSSVKRRKKDQSKRGLGRFMEKVLGGEFLLDREMLPWYPFILFVVLLMAVSVVSEQRIVEKKEKITELENEYKAELSKLKTNNQFIPYEENQILIETMKTRGYVLDEKHNYTVVVEKPVKEKKRRWFRKEAQNGE